MTERARKVLRDVGLFAGVIAIYLLMMLVVLPRLGFST